MINKIGKVTLYVKNQDEAKAFWTEKLNFTSTDITMGPIRWLEVRPNDSAFTSFVLYDKEIMKSQDPTINLDVPSIILSTVDIDKSHKEMKEKGIIVEDMMNMTYGRMFVFKDQDGNKFLLREDK